MTSLAQWVPVTTSATAMTTARAAVPQTAARRRRGGRVRAIVPR